MIAITTESTDCTNLGLVPLFERNWLGTKMGYYKDGHEPTQDPGVAVVPSKPAVV